jgi:hypothetical protein
MFACLAGDLVAREHTIKTHEASYVPRAAKPFFIPVVHSPLRSWDTWQHQSSPLREAEPGVMGHVTAPEFTSSERRGLELRDT